MRKNFYFYRDNTFFIVFFAQFAHIIYGKKPYIYSHFKVYIG